MIRGPRQHKPKKQRGELPSPFVMTIDSLTHDGRGVGRHNGRAVMVKNALPHEEVEVRIEKATSKLWQGRAKSILTLSPRRISPQCEHTERCGGCQLQHVDHIDQIQLKQDIITEHFQRNSVLIPEFDDPILSSPFEYRHRARLHVTKKGVIGFHEEQGHNVVPVEHCPVMIPQLQSLFNELKQNAPILGIQQLELIVDDQGKPGLSVLKAEPRSRKRLEEWATGIGWTINTALHYKAGEQTVFAQPGQFTQVNRQVNQQVIEQARQWLAIDAETRLLDLFCGNGNLSVPFLALVKASLGFEASEPSIQQARRAASDFAHADYEVADLFTADLQDHELVQKLQPNAVVLDPPRAGAEQVVRWLPALEGLRKILYISCDPATMARDIKQLTDDKWHLRKLGMIDMFPQTRHIETMALLEK